MCMVSACKVNREMVPDYVDAMRAIGREERKGALPICEKSLWNPTECWERRTACLFESGQPTTVAVLRCVRTPWRGNPPERDSGFQRRAAGYV